MSLDATLIDLDDRVIYDISGGRHLWWLLPRLNKHRIIITHDNNEAMDLEIISKFESLRYKIVDCDSLSLELDIDFSILPEDFYSIRVNLVDLAYGICFNIQNLKWLPPDFKLNYGADEESKFCWFSVSGVGELVNCTDNLYSICLSGCYDSTFGNELSDKAFVENLKEFGKLVDSI